MERIIYMLMFISLLCSCEEKNQNFVFILVDDLGWKDLGYAGSTFYETPNIDALSKQAIRFTRAYASGSVCSPSRAAIMTGRHPARLHITDWIPGSGDKGERLKVPSILNQLPLEEQTLAEVLKQNGYQTFFAGKWHLGGEGYFPENQGFEINKGGHEAGSPPGGYYTPYKNPKLEDGSVGEYLTDRLTNESMEFLSKINDKPFLLYLSFYTVHMPIQPNLEAVDHFRNKLEGLSEKEAVTRSEGRGVSNLSQINPEYASMVYAMDKNVGRLIAKLKKEGLYENTTIIFTSDNGGLSTLNRNRMLAPTSTFPLRGGKGWLYEGGIRVPLLIKPANYSGSSTICETPIVGHDFYPTILSLAGIQSEKGATLIDGTDLSELLMENKEIESRELFWYYPHYHGSGWTPGAAILKDNWKLIEFYETNTIELYDLSNDESESQDLSQINPEKAEFLHNRLHKLQQSMGADGVTFIAN